MQDALFLQIHRRILIFLTALVVLFAAAMIWVHRVEETVGHEIMTSETSQHGMLFDRVLDLAARPLEMFVDSYGRRTFFTRTGDDRLSNEAQDVLAAGLRTFRLDGAWVLNADDSIRLQAFAEAQTALPLPGLPPPADRANRLRFYFEQGGVPYLLHGRRLAADARAPAAARGWIVAAMRFDAPAVNLPAAPIEGTVVVLPAHASLAKAPGAYVQVDRPLPGADGKPVAMLRLYYAPTEVAILGIGLLTKRYIMVGFAGAVLVLLAYCLWRWVVRPANIMRAALVAGDAAHLQPLLAAGGDFGRLAGLVRDLIESRAALRTNVEDRARLDRDLHDGVIQTIYSSGMAVTHARAVLHSDPKEAERLLDKVHGELTATIREVRSLLAGLTPEPTVRRTFGEVATAVLDQARASNPGLRVTVNVDEALAARLPLALRSQLLQFARECVSNAARHAHASALRLALGDRGGQVVLEIADDGSGFDPKVVKPGRGLQNLAERAQTLGAKLTVDSAPKRGTRIELSLPRAHHD